MDFRVVIPSYKRYNELASKTLTTLEKYEIDLDRITIWVASQEEKVLYEEAIPASKRPEIIVGVLGLAPQRNKILEFYPIGTKLVFMDDDIEDIVQLSENKLKDVDSLLGQFQIGFEEAERANTILWGVGPVPNGFFMRNTITKDLKFCVGPLFGLINPGVEKLTLPMCEKEDYIRTLMVYEMYGSVVRLNYLAVKTKYFVNKGGMMAKDRLERQKVAVAYILNRWPDLARLNTKRKSEFPEILLRRATRKFK